MEQSLTEKFSSVEIKIFTSLRAYFFCKIFKGRKNCVLVKKFFSAKLSKKFGGDSVKNLEILTERGTVLNGVLFSEKNPTQF